VTADVRRVLAHVDRAVSPAGRIAAPAAAPCATLQVMPSRDPAALRAFANRDWASAAEAKALWWRDWKREHGPAAGLRIGDELRRQALAARPDWPSEREREEDLAMHLRLIEVIRRVPRAR
jgi:hypothetical protein